MRTEGEEYEIVRGRYLNYHYGWSVVSNGLIGGRAYLWGPPLTHNPNGCIGISVYPTGHGVGSTLLARLIREYHDEHPDHMLYAWIAQTNYASQGLFKKFGFVDTGETYNRVNNWWVRVP